MRWSQTQLDEYRGKLRLWSPGELDQEADPGPESSLQRKIEAWCKEWGRPILSFHQSKAAKRLLPPGWPDLTIIMPNRVIFIELKSAKGRLSPEQKQLRMQFMALGHDIYEIRSFKRFKEVIECL